MIITYDYPYGKEEFYNKVNLLFDKLEEIDGGKISRNINESKNKVDFVYWPYDLQGNVQLQENKLIIEGKIPKIRPNFFHKINLFTLIFNPNYPHNVNSAKENIEKNLEHAIKDILEERFN